MSNKQKFNVTYVFVSPESVEDCDFPRDLFGSTYDDRQEGHDFELASINDLRYKIVDQKREIEMGGPQSSLELLTPWDGIVIVSEGYYEWDIISGDYRRLSNEEVSQKVKPIEDTFADEVRDAVFNALKAVDIEFDQLGAGEGYTENDEPIIIIHVIRKGGNLEFPFLEADVRRKGIEDFADMIVEGIRRGDNLH